MRFLSLFAGIGGMDLGLERAGMTCVGQCEIDPFCSRVLAKHWPNVWRHDDVRTLTGAMVEEHCGPIDLICGGFPCQDISDAGLKVGLDGARSRLFYQLTRIVDAVQPRYVLVENVSALFERGFGTVLGTLAALGFDAEWGLLPAGAFGLPHVRQRVFVVAYPHGLGRSQLLHRHAPTLPKAAPRRKRKLDALDSLAGFIEGLEQGYSEPALCRSTDGIPNIVDRLRGLGNAVVPQVAEYIGRMIMTPKGPTP